MKIRIHRDYTSIEYDNVTEVVTGPDFLEIVHKRGVVTMPYEAINGWWETINDDGTDHVDG